MPCVEVLLQLAEEHGSTVAAAHGLLPAAVALLGSRSHAEAQLAESLLRRVVASSDAMDEAATSGLVALQRLAKGPAVRQAAAAVLEGVATSSSSSAATACGLTPLLVLLQPGGSRAALHEHAAAIVRALAGCSKACAQTLQQHMAPWTC
jgi:hypothetical protein